MIHLMQQVFEKQRTAFASNPYASTALRRERLSRLMALLLDNEEKIIAAIDADFGGRPRTETRLLEIFPSLEGLRYAQRHVAGWMRPEPRQTSLWFFPGRSEVHYQPLGVVGVVVPWNYPLYLALEPMTAALAAGNHVMVKMSEYSPRLGELLAQLLPKYLPAEVASVVNGGADVGQAFCGLPWNHLLFTGSTAVGRQVMRAAAEHLTPVTLELGGKSPVLLAPGAVQARYVKRLAFAKLLNAGQTCIAPDYVLVHDAELETFKTLMQQSAQALYGSMSSPDYTHIINERHYTRLQALIDDAQQRGAHLTPLLTGAACGRQLVPALVSSVNDSMSIMQEEIFGPFLPVVTYSSVEQALTYIQARPRPLALYLFDHQAQRIQYALRHTHSGGITLNDCLLQVAQEDLPFGGVGASGMGRYHGPEGFKTFSNARSVFRQSRLSMASVLYPPYGRIWAERLLRFMLRR